MYNTLGGTCSLRGGNVVCHPFRFLVGLFCLSYLQQTVLWPKRLQQPFPPALVHLCNTFFYSSGSYKDSEGLRHHDEFDVSLLVCHSAAPFEEQSETERHVLR